MLVCYILAGSLALLVLLYICFELNYFLRLILCVLAARLFKKRVHILQETTVTGVCVTNDVDALLYHMNNARYLRELDFARVDFYERSGLYRRIREKGGSVVQGACTIRYRRFVKTFSRYTITSKIVYWDEKSIFMEHRFITPRDNFICAIAICRQRVIDCNAEDVMSSLLVSGTVEDAETAKLKPELPKEVALWIESNEISSLNIRSGG